MITLRDRLVLLAGLAYLAFAVFSAPLLLFVLARKSFGATGRPNRHATFDNSTRAPARPAAPHMARRSSASRTGTSP